MPEYDDDSEYITSAKNEPPGPGPMDEHRALRLYEDAMFLMDSGLSFELTALRLGLQPVGLEKVVERHERRAS